MAKKHKGHYCKICDEYKSNESFSGKVHAQHICKGCMGEMKKGNKKVLDLPFGDNEFEMVDADEYIDTILYGNNEERETKTFKKLNREQKMVLKAIVQDEVTLYWQAYRQIPVNDKLKQLRNSVNIVVYEQLYFAADILFDQFGIYLGNVVEISVQCCISAMGTQDHIIFYRIDSFVFCTKILIGA